MVKRGTPATQLTGLELRALRKLQRESEASQFVFVSERGAPFSTFKGFWGTSGYRMPITLRSNRLQRYF